MEALESAVYQKYEIILSTKLNSSNHIIIFTAFEEVVLIDWLMKMFCFFETFTYNLKVSFCMLFFQIT